MIYRWSIDISMKYRWSIDDLPMIEPCFGMNGHPRARVDTILRQCEAEVKINNSRWFPASIYRSNLFNIAGQGTNIEKSSKKLLFGISCGFFYRSRGSRGPSGRVQNRSQSLKIIKCIDFSKSFSKSMKNWFDPINGDDFLRRCSLCPLELPIP